MAALRELVVLLHSGPLGRLGEGGQAITPPHWTKPTFHRLGRLLE